MKKKYSSILNIIIIFLVTALVFYFSLKDDYQNIINTIINLNPIYLIIAIIFVFLYWFFRSLSLLSMIKSIKKDYTWKRCFILVLITQFFNAITPFSTGGQPFQIYHLKKDGISYTDGTNIIMQNFIVYQIALVFLGIIALIYNQIFHIFDDISILKSLVTIGFLINILVIVSLFLLAFSNKLSDLALKFISLFLKNNESKKEKIQNFKSYIERFHLGAKILIRNKKQFFLNIGFNFISLTILYSIPFVILIGMNNNEISLINTIVSSAYTMLIGSFVPIPGATGGLEYGYISFFGQFVKGAALNASMLLWRGITYYLGLIVGAITLSIKKDVKK